MSQVGILTDSTAQFSTPYFPGHKLVTVLPLQIQINGRVYPPETPPALAEIPVSIPLGRGLTIQLPSPETFSKTIEQLGSQYHEIILILISKDLNPLISLAHEVVETSAAPAALHIIDSQTTSVGLGMLVQAAAEAAQNGLSAQEIKHLLHGMIARTYTLFCLQSLTYLYHLGQFDPAQAILGEMLKLSPVFSLEKGRLTLIHKAHGPRQIMELFAEFINEVLNLRSIALIKGNPTFLNETNSLRERIRDSHPATPYSEHNLSPVVSAMLGPRSLGLVVTEG